LSKNVAQKVHASVAYRTSTRKSVQETFSNYRDIFSTNTRETGDIIFEYERFIIIIFSKIQDMWGRYLLLLRCFQQAVILSEKVRFLIYLHYQKRCHCQILLLCIA